MMWEKVRLENLCTIVRGSSPRPQGDARYYGGNIPRLMIEDLTRDGKYVTPQVDSLTEEGAKLSRPMKKGDLVITVSGRTGVPAILAVDACIHDGFVGFRDLLDKINIDYLFHYLSSLTAITSQQAVGAIFKNLTTEQLKNLEIPLPPLPIQKRIAEILDTADALRRKDEALLKKYDELAQAIFIDMFGDPVKNEKGWEVKKLGDLTTHIRSGNTPLGGSNVYKKTGITFFRSQNVWKNNLIYDDIAFIDEETHNAMKNSSLKNNDILMTKTGRINTENSSLGRAALYTGSDDRANINGHVYLIRLVENQVHQFVLHILTSKEYRNLIREVCVGGIDKRQLNKEHIEDFPIIYPPIEVQKSYAEKILSIQKQRMHIEKTAHKSEQIFNSLLQKAFNGELVA